MKKLFKKSIACLIAVLMVVSSMPFTALTANAAETKTDISVWNASNASLTEHGDRFVFADGTANQSFTGIEWGSQALNSGYASLDNATGSFGVISSSSIDNIWSTTTMDSSGFEALGINGSHWSFSAKFAFTDTSNTNDNVTIFGIGTSKTYTYSNANAYLTSGQAADIVDLKKDGRLFIGDASESATTLTTADFVSTDATKPITVTVEYNNGTLSLSVGEDIKYTTTVTNTELFEKGVSNYFVGAPAQVYTGGNFAYYAGASGGTARQNGNNCIFGFNLYSLSASVFSDPTIVPAVPASANAQTAFNNINSMKTEYSTLNINNAGTDYMRGIISGTNWGGHVEEQFTYEGKNKNKYRIHSLTNSVALYTGEDSVRIPVVFENPGQSPQSNVTSLLGFDYVALNGVNNFTLGNSTWTRINGWTDFTNNSDSSYSFSSSSQTDVKRATNFSKDSGTSVATSDRFDQNSSKLWKNYIKYTGNNQTTYYDRISAPNFTSQADYAIYWRDNYELGYGWHYAWSYKTDNRQVKSGVNVYVLNFAPLLNIMNSSDFKTNFETIYNNRWMYDDEAREKYFDVMAKITTFNLSEKTMTNESQVSAVAAEIKGMVDDYKRYKSPAKKNITVTFRNSTDTATISTKTFEAGNAIGEFPANTETSPDEYGYGDIYHNKYSWDTALTAESVPTSDIRIVEKATPEAHSSKTPATCTTKQTCDACGAKFGNFADHSYTVEKTPEVPATCTTTGTTAVMQCENCDATTGGVTIPATGEHNYNVLQTAEVPATCTTTGTTAVYKCATCDLTTGGVTIPANGHTEVIDAAVAPTCTETGLTEGKHCSVCNTVLVEQEDVPATGHNYGEPVYDEKTKTDIFTCTNCGDTISKAVADKDALNAAIVALQNDLDLPEAGYKYDAARVEAAKALIAQAKALGRYEEQSVVNAKAEAIATAKTELNAAENLAKYTITVQVVNSDDENDEVVKGLGGTYKDIPYGETFTHNVNIPIINDGSSLSGLPQYAVYKWMVGDVKLNTADTSISGVVKGNATYICYVLNFKASTDVGGVPTTTRVRYLDKSGHTVDFDQAIIGQPYTRKDTSKAPVIPYYTCTGWEPVFGDESNVGTRELVYRAIYTFNETEANRCTIVGLPGVYVNGTTGTPGYTAYYDEKIQLTGADKYAYANADGSIIAPINESYIFAPHLNGVDKTIYITKVETPVENATSIITGTFTTKDDPKYNYLVVNAQFYLPENATAVESGIVIGNQNDANVLKIGSATKVVSTSQGDNHEYSIQMSYSKGKTGTLYARSYLIYVDSNGDTQTVYSDDITTCNLD